MQSRCTTLYQGKFPLTNAAISEINLIISGLPHQVRKEEIKAYFGRHMRGDTAEVVDVLLLGSGKAKVVISGLTEEGTNSQMFYPSFYFGMKTYLLCYVS